MPTQFGGTGCRYLVDSLIQCGAPPTVASSYCAEHHALCYIAPHSIAERKQLRTIEAIGKRVGGRFGSSLAPLPQFLDRIERR